MKNQTCCFTGHRYIQDFMYPEIQKRLKKEIIKLIEQGVCYFGAGGALGFDTMAALTVIKLRRKYPNIKLILVLPCKEQTKKWNEKDIKIYNQILGKADKVVYTSEYYYDGCMLLRNRHLVNYSQFCLCYLKETTSGAAYTVNYAKQKGLQIINLADPTSAL